MFRLTKMYLATTAWALMSFSGMPYPGPTGTAFAQEATVTSPVEVDDAPEPLSDEELEVLVARIALYPDDLVALVSSASLYPLQVIEAARFLEDLKKDKTLKPKSTWDGSIVSLLNYPDIVKMMSDDLDWTQSLGDALANQQKDVLIAIQQLRNKAVADGVIKSDDKMTIVQENDNIVIQPTSEEKIYVPQYEPAMLYEPSYVPQPIGYYPDPYPNYSYPSAPFFAAVVTGAVFAAAVDWNDWGVWGGRWNGGDIDIDCNHCLNNVGINGKLKMNDIDWKNVDRDKIKFDRNQLSKIDRNSIRENIKSDKRNNIKIKANVISSNRGGIHNNVGTISAGDIRKSKIAGDRNRGNISSSNRLGAGGNIAQGIPIRRPAAKPDRPSLNVNTKPNFNRPAGKPRPGGLADNRPKRPSALGNVDSGRRANLESHRGRQAMGGGNRGAGGNRGGGGHREIHRGGGGHR